MNRKKLPKKILTIIEIMKEIEPDKQKVLIERFCNGKSMREVSEEKGCSYVYIGELEGKLIKKIADALNVKI